MKATEQCFPVVLFIMLYKVVLTFESVDEILKYDHSNLFGSTLEYETLEKIVEFVFGYTWHERVNNNDA